jgi:hypothetical protein
MITALVIGDPHFKTSNVKEMEGVTKSVLEIARARVPDFIVIMGDNLDRHELIHVTPLTMATKFIIDLSQLAPTYVLIGNHDLKNNSQFLSGEHGFTAFKYLKNKTITIVDSPIDRIFGDHRFVFVPYVPPGRFQEALTKVPEWQKARVIFAHQEFRGCRMGETKSIISTNGDLWEPQFPQVISGHIHDYQTIQNNILYLGTPVQHSFSDDREKTISWFTFLPALASSHESSSSYESSPKVYEEERIDLGLPKKYVDRIRASEIEAYLPRDHCELKIIIHGTTGEIKATMRHPKIIEWKKLGHKITYKEVDLHGPQISLIGSSTVPKFSSLLYQSIKDQPELVDLYQSIFGVLEVEEVAENQPIRIIQEEPRPIKKNIVIQILEDDES